MNPVLSKLRTSGDPAANAAGSAPASLVDLLVRCVADGPDRRAVIDGLGCVDGTGAGREGLLPRTSTWAEIAAAAVGLADRLETAGLVRGDRLAHVGSHSPDWIAVDLACLLAGIVHVALHADAAAAEHDAQIAWLDPRGIVFSGAKDPPRLREARGRIVIDLTSGRAASSGGAATASRHVAADPAAVLGQLRRQAEACDPDACCTILLSSGTTGLPHGVLHSQRALATNAIAAADVFLDAPRDVRLSWLPMSHALARTGDLYTALVRGGCLNVVRERGRVLEACRAVPPTVVLGVPAFFERLEQGVRSGRIPNLREALGGGVRVCVSGAAALRNRTAECFAAAGVPLVEGYGLAEAGPVVALSNPRIARPGTVGPPLAGVEVRIDDRQESRGQLLVRTPSRALGVVRMPERESSRSEVGAASPRPGHLAEAEGARDAGGGTAPPHDGAWLETGDLAAIDEAGQVRITGRLRDTLVLATGVKVPPAEVERALAEDEAVAQVCVVGDGLPWPVALVVPEPAVLRGAIRRMRARVFSRRAALEHPRVLAWFARRLARRQRELPRGWQVRRAVLVGRPFDAAHGEATESLKQKRRTIELHFRDRIAKAAV